MWTTGVVVGLGTYNIHDNNIMTENIRILRITIIYSLLAFASKQHNIHYQYRVIQ